MISVLKRSAAAGILGLAALSLGACATDYAGNAYSSAEAGVPVEVYRGRLLSIQPASIRTNQQGAGAAAGALAGGTIGAVVGRNSKNPAAAGILGAVVGGVLGAAAEADAASAHGYRYLVELPDGRTIAVVQGDPRPIAAAGQEVLVEYGSRVRVAPAF